MIKIYCKDHHTVIEDLCPECRDLLNYAEKRLRLCPFDGKKPTCGKCKIHCYTTIQRQKIIEVMRYSGPRMIYKHPIMAIRHLFDSRIKPKKASK